MSLVALADPVTGTKHCPKCDRDLPANGIYFTADASNPDGLTYNCRDCRNAQHRAWYQSDQAVKERRLATGRDLRRKRPRRDISAMPQPPLDENGKAKCVCVVCGMEFTLTLKEWRRRMRTTVHGRLCCSHVCSPKVSQLTRTPIYEAGAEIPPKTPVQTAIWQLHRKAIMDCREASGPDVADWSDPANDWTPAQRRAVYDACIRSDAYRDAYLAAVEVEGR